VIATTYSTQTNIPARDSCIWLRTCSVQKKSKLEQLQQFGKSTWHPYNFGKIRKIGIQQFGKPTWQK
jgi:hypothetical protein